MNGSAQHIYPLEAAGGNFASDSRISWIGSKLIQSIGVETDRLDAVHTAMMLRILQKDSNAQAPAVDESDALAAQIVAVARIAEQGAAMGGPSNAIASVLRESGKSVEPLLAQNFIRLASSAIFWMALGTVRENRAM